ncbi:hypothetical protein V6N13_055646 [Hibiscus sabdariffa]
MSWPGIQMRRNSWQDGVLDGDIVILICDWYTQNHTALRTTLDSGAELGMPDGVLINGKGPYRYNTTLVPAGIEYESFNVEPEGPATGPLPVPPIDIYNKWSAMNQPKSIRQNTSASGARPNPQGSFHYGSINSLQKDSRSSSGMTLVGGNSKFLTLLITILPYFFHFYPIVM